MKKSNLCFTLIALLFLFSCGSSDTKSEKITSSKQTSFKFLYDDDNLTVANCTGWENKTGPNGLGFYTWAIESSGDIYKDITDDYSEKLSDVVKVTVDNLPALTMLKKYQQNETIKERLWLIYNGKDIIQFSVMAPFDKFDDAKANELIKHVKIKHRETTVELPEPKFETKEKPDHFPQQIAENLSGYFSSESVLSIESINSAKNFNEQLKRIKNDESNINIIIEKDNMPILDSIAATHKLNNWSHFERIVNASAAAIDPIIGLMIDLEQIEKESANYNLTVDAIQQIASQTKPSLNDIKFVYDNWEFTNEFVDNLE